jgi:RimJ/RimL family protein N-acetyltransferase
LPRPDHVDPPDPPLSDGTVTLRPMRESDLPGLMEEGGDETTRRWVNVPIPYTEEDAREELTQLMGSWDDPASPLALTITESGSDEYRGVILLSTERPSGIIEVAYGVHPAARRRGLVTRAIRLVSPWAFSGAGRRAAGGANRPGEHRLAACARAGRFHPRGVGAGIAVGAGRPQGHDLLVAAALRPPLTRRLPDTAPGYPERMIWLLLLILAILVFGVFGAIKLAFWVLLLAVLVAVVAGFLGRGLFTGTR